MTKNVNVALLFIVNIDQITSFVLYLNFNFYLSCNIVCTKHLSQDDAGHQLSRTDVWEVDFLKLDVILVVFTIWRIHCYLEPCARKNVRWNKKFSEMWNNRQLFSSTGFRHLTSCQIRRANDIQTKSPSQYHRMSISHYAYVYNLTCDSIIGFWCISQAVLLSELQDVAVEVKGIANEVESICIQS